MVNFKLDNSLFQDNSALNSMIFFTNSRSTLENSKFINNIARSKTKNLRFAHSTTWIYNCEFNDTHPATNVRGSFLMV